MNRQKTIVILTDFFISHIPTQCLNIYNSFHSTLFFVFFFQLLLRLLVPASLRFFLHNLSILTHKYTHSSKKKEKLYLLGYAAVLIDLYVTYFYIHSRVNGCVCAFVHCECIQHLMLSQNMVIFLNLAFNVQCLKNRRT